jgi:hypothetical protein
MKYWKYVDGDDGSLFGYQTVSEADIIKDFFPDWERDMIAMGREEEISHENCIQEWVVYFGAWQ